MARTVRQNVTEFDDLAPKIKIKVSGTELNEDVTKYVTDIEVDLARDMADQIKLSVINPIVEKDGIGKLGGLKSGHYLFIDSKIFAVGNVISIYMGYGNKTEHIASGIIQKWMPEFPQSGTPMLNIKALDHSWLLMEGEFSTTGRGWQNVGHDEVVIDILNGYGIDNVIADVPSVIEHNFFKKQGMSDYKFVVGLANLHGYYFKVSYDPEKSEPIARWGVDTTVFGQQVGQYTFTYGDGDDSTLLSFQPQYAINQAPSKVQLTYYDQNTKSWELVPVETDGETGILKYTGDGSVNEEGQTLEEEILSSAEFRITAGGKSVEVVPYESFESAEEAQRWAENWFNARKDNFITGRGVVIGVENLRPGQVHIITGVGQQLSGEYEFTTVTHKYTDNGYICEFFAHKVLTS